MDMQAVRRDRSSVKVACGKSDPVSCRPVTQISNDLRSDPELPRGNLRILAVELVLVPHLHEEENVRILLFDLHKLLLFQWRVSLSARADLFFFLLAPLRFTARPCRWSDHRSSPRTSPAGCRPSLRAAARSSSLSTDMIPGGGSSPVGVSKGISSAAAASSPPAARLASAAAASSRASERRRSNQTPWILHSLLPRFVQPLLIGCTCEDGATA